MKTENKQLTTRQDILDVWVEKGAKINSMSVKTINETATGNRAMKLGDYGMDAYCTDVYEILYSPESNFFQCLFSKSGLPELASIHKKDCVTSPDPLQYLLSVLNCE